MIEVSEIKRTPPEEFSTPLQQTIYCTLQGLGIEFERVDNSPSHTMEEAVYINSRLGGRMAKNILLTNRQQTRFWLLVMAADKPFVTRDFSHALEIPRVSFAPEEKLRELLGVEYGAANILCTLTDTDRRYQLVIDRDVLREPSFMLPDGTVTSHLKISTADLTDKLLPHSGHTPIIIEL